MGAVVEPGVVLDRVVELAGDPPVQAFARAYLRRPSQHGEDDPDPEALLAEILGAYGLAANRSGPVAVRAFTPSRAEHGYDTGGSVVETNTEDLPFLVDSVTGEVAARGYAVRRLTHPIMGIERDDRGGIARVLHPRDAAARESVMHFELDRRLTPEELVALEDGVRAVLATVREVVQAFPALVERLDRMAGYARATEGVPEAELEDSVAFLRWLNDDHFVFLGYEEPGETLALGTDGAPICGPDLITVSKTNRVSPVHRRERMDAVAVKRPAGGEARLLGLFTSRAYAEPASATPLLHRKLERILEAEDLIEGSHDYKAAVHLFDSFPMDELFASTVEEIRVAVSALLTIQGDEVRLLGRLGRDGCSAALIAALPRSRYSASLRERLRAAMVEVFGGARVDVHEVLQESDRVQVHFAVHDSAGLKQVDIAALEARVQDLARTWADLVRDVLVAKHGDERGRMLAARWVKRLPESYRAATPPALAAEDLVCLETLVTSAEDFVVGLEDEADRSRVTLYKRGPKVELSKATPMLEDMGLRVIEEIPTRLDGPDELWLQSFSVLGEDDHPLDLDDCRKRVADTLVAVWRGDAESDSLNRLVIGAGLEWNRVEVLRASRRYRQRIGSRYTESFQNDVIAANPEITRKLADLFEMRFRPGKGGDDEALHAEILEDLDAVELLDHDRILRNQLGLIDATVRTNVYRRGRGAMAFKLRSADVPAIPLPAPLFEIYVYAPDMEGIHLRGGKIARGGLRWSDRMDYRTEVFGLLRAQMTKNAIIVPAGAKGGFILKGARSDPAEARHQYIRYIEALLDVTDNLVDGAVVHPDGVRVHDEDDTYLVVAADKGTATLSDTANEVSVRRGFWLGDAFASGGSTGYDHKALGITARGAWESVKRHFRELGADPERDEITAVGIGDMSGDVFGNGMLLSSTLKLVAAYDHRHIFIDPDPNPTFSHAERKRLFELPGSSWDDYDRSLISEGGGVWPRTLKSIPLSEQAREALGVSDEKLMPNEVIRAILRAPVDLLWNGGIGTVIKASTETDADALDRSSDAIRVDAADVRARVVGEGGNLGLTQRGRIELARKGGRVNADFIDNSAGVDCSDHEVNLKILLDLAVRRGELSVEDRNAALREVTDDVVRLVLEDSFLQAQILAEEQRVSATRIFAYEDLMVSLENEGLLDRAVEFLPSSEEMAERRRGGRGLETPELAVLLAYAKRSLITALLESSLPDDEAFAAEARKYFPPAIVERFGHLIPEHPLRRELVATIAANDALNAMGATFVSRLVAELGVEPADVVRARRRARDMTGAVARWEAVEHADVAPEPYWELMSGVDDLVEDVTRWELVHAREQDLEADHEGFARLEAALTELRSERWRDECDATAAALVDRGVPDSLARAHALQPALVHAPDIVAVARETGWPVDDVARVFFLIGEGLSLEWLEREIDALPSGTRLQRWAAQAVRDDVLAARRMLARRAVQDADGRDPEAAVEGFLASREEPRRRLSSFTRALALEGSTDLAGLTLAVRHLMDLAG